LAAEFAFAVTSDKVHALLLAERVCLFYGVG